MSKINCNLKDREQRIKINKPSTKNFLCTIDTSGHRYFVCLETGQFWYCFKENIGCYLFVIFIILTAYVYECTCACTCVASVLVTVSEQLSKAGSLLPSQFPGIKLRFSYLVARIFTSEPCFRLYCCLLNVAFTYLFISQLYNFKKYGF